MSICEAQICQDVRDAHNFAVGISRLTHLSHLDLSRTFMCASGARCVAAALQACRALRVLRLNDLRICQGSSRQFADSVAKTLASLVQLRELHLSHCFMPSSALAAAVGSLKCLQVLRMSGATLGDAGAIRLAESLREVPWLEVLDISNSDVHHRGMAALGPVLRKMNGLRELVLTGNRIWPEGATALSGALQPGMANCGYRGSPGDLHNYALSDSGPQGLQLLDLSYCGVGPSGLEALAPALLTLTALRELNMHGLPPGAGRVARVIQRLRAAHHSLFIGS